MARRECTEENPYTKERDETEPGRRWSHEGAHEIGEQEDGYPGGDTVKMGCKNCNVEWTKELAQ